MRLFVALDIDAAIRERIWKFVEGVRGFAPDVRWVGPESFHVTLKFLGETDKLDDVKRALSEVHAAPVTLTFRSTGYFPSHKAGRVFWVGIHADEKLPALASAVESALRPLGFEPEKAPYRPHLTLARAGGRDRGSHQKFKLLQKKLSGMPEPDFGTMTAREFCVYESKLSPRGAQYAKVARFALNAPQN